MFKNLIVRQHMQIEILLMVDAHGLVIIGFHLLEVGFGL